MSAPVAVGVDVGGTNVRAALVAADGTATSPGRVPSPFADAEALADAVARVVAEVDAPDLPVGVGLAGSVHRDGTVGWSGNLGLRDAPLGRLVRERLGRPVTVVNDASAALWGERVAGAARGHDDALLVTLGTGVGGALVTAGRLVEGWQGIAGEVGHVVAVHRGAQCPCGNLGCVEAYASGTSMARRATGRLRTWDRDSVLDDVGAEPTGADVVAAARDGDELAREVVAEAGTMLGVGVASIVSLVDPAVVVIGGGAGADAFDLLRPSLLRSLREHVFGLAGRVLPDVVVAELGDRAGVVGAGVLAAGGSA